MSILTDNLPSYIEIDGEIYPVRCDFRVWLEFDSIMNGSLSPDKKISAAMRMCFPLEEMKFFPPSCDKTFLALIDFYNGGIPSSRSTTKGERVLSFEEDAPLIYAAFLSEYNIDLLSVPFMHWFCFLALFRGLSENSRIMKIIAIRGADLDKIKNQSERDYYKRLKEIYALSATKSSCERDTDIAKNLFQMF